MTVLSKFYLTTWGQVVASGFVSENPYFTPSDRYEPRLNIDGVQVWREQEDEIWQKLDAIERELVEEMLAESFEESTNAILDYAANELVDSR